MSDPARTDVLNPSEALARTCVEIERSLRRQTGSRGTRLAGHCRGGAAWAAVLEHERNPIQDPDSATGCKTFCL